jgi:very-short-patch-repair endonuclease
MEEYKDNLFHGANSKLFEFSKALRRNQTEAEEIIWQCLRNRKILNFKFRRQHPIHQYIADFYCHEAKLIIEIDGGIHNNSENQEYDQNRTDELMKIGITVIRFTNQEVNNNLDEVINIIKNYLLPENKG